jgi:hypothetical protein
MKFECRTLDNGLTIIGEVNPLAQSAAVGFFVRTGARDETSQISGVSHADQRSISLSRTYVIQGDGYAVSLRGERGF